MLFVIVLVLMIVPCQLGGSMNMTENAIKKVWLVQGKERGIAGSYLQENEHVLNELA